MPIMLLCWLIWSAYFIKIVNSNQIELSKITTKSELSKFIIEKEQSNHLPVFQKNDICIIWYKLKFDLTKINKELNFDCFSEYKNEKRLNYFKKMNEQERKEYDFSK